ncbi:MAG: 2OG-Fe(II) oxygenase [Archangium sp.]|nr:2OG-Fe(II) oxygenase [Archangium sp.]
MVIRLLPDPERELSTRNPLVLTIPDVLNPAECAAFIERMEGEGLSDAPITTNRGPMMRKDIRNNTRVMFDDVAFAAKLFERVRAHLPERLESELIPVGANERLRCYRYVPGQYFAPHFDGYFRRENGEESQLTLMVYLNECERGGHTVFHDLELDVKPVPGMALLFNHRLLHEGAEVLAGIKYAVRSDVMYRAA